MERKDFTEVVYVAYTQGIRRRRGNKLDVR